MTGTGITERANAIRAEVERLPSLRQEATNAEAVTTRADQLEKLASDLRTRTARFQLFQDQGLVPHIVRERPETLLAMTRMHRSRFEDDRSSIAADPEDSGLKWRYRDELSRLIHSIDRALDDAWRHYVDSLIPAGLDSQLELLGNAGVLADQIVRMRELGDELKEARSNTASDTSAFELAKGSAGELRGLWETLSGIPADVRAFIAAASTDGAPIDALTPAVRTWLEENGFLDSVRLVMKGGA